jgi:Domain of unknown function (DUF222)/HNH endonuclease
VLAGWAQQLDAGRLRRLAGRLREILAPNRHLAEANAAHARRRLHLSQTFDGLWALDGLLDAEAGATVWSALAALNTPAGPADTRNPAQRRADALVELARTALHGGQLPRAGGEPPQVNLIVDLPTLLPMPLPTGLPSARAAKRDPAPDPAAGPEAGPEAGPAAGPAADPAAEAVTVSAAGPPGIPAAALAGRLTTGLAGLSPELLERTGAWLDWAGPVPPDTARRISCDAGVTRLLTAGPGRLLDLGRTTRTITRAQRRALAVRDGGCRFPGCDRPPQWTDGHHIQHWVDGGPTDLDNLLLLCRTHHRFCHEAGWTITGTPTHGLTFIPPGATSNTGDPEAPGTHPPSARPCSGSPGHDPPQAA